MNDQGLSRALQNYYTSAEIDKNNFATLMKYILEFGQTQRKQEMIETIFRNMQSTTTKENLKIVYKRYLFLINQILVNDHLKYRQSLSHLLPAHYLFILKGALNNAMDLVILLKHYRKKWAKRISDHAFYQIHKDAVRQQKFDLDKGFPEDLIKKIHKEYRKRKFTEEEIQRYMPTRTKNESEERVVGDSSSSSEEISRPEKKVKYDHEARKDRTNNFYATNDSMTPHSSFNSSLAPVAPRIDPRYYSYPNPSYPYASYPHYQGNYLQAQPYFQSHVSTHAPTHIPNHAPNHTPNQGYHYQNQSHYPQPQQYPQYVQNSQPVRKGTEVFNNMQDLLIKMKETKGYECKFCGLLLSTSEKHQAHLQSHFTEAQRQYEASHSRRDHARKNLMPTVEQWLQFRKSKLQAALKLFVPIKGGFFENEVCCMICQGALKINWCPEMDSWVFEDAMKVKCGREKEKVCHEECYQALTELDASD